MSREGELWSFFRALISQGTYIQMDYAAGKYKCYEEFSARLDSAARERVDEFLHGRQDPPLGMEAHMAERAAQETRAGHETRAPHYDTAANFARSCTVADPVDKECSYCFGEGAVSMSNGERRMCTLCNGTGKVRAEPEPAPRNMFDGAPMKVVEWPAIPSKPSSDK